MFEQFENVCDQSDLKQKHSGESNKNARPGLLKIAGIILAIASLPVAALSLTSAREQGNMHEPLKHGPEATVEYTHITPGIPITE